MDQPEITDDATELATLAGILASTAAASSGFNSLAKQIGISPDDPVFLELLCVMKERVAALKKFAEELGDDALSPHLRSDVIGATQNLMQLLLTTYLASHWEPQRAQIVNEVNMNSLRWFGDTMRKHRPLYKIDAGQLSELQSRLQAQLEEISSGDYLDWERPILISGLQRIQKTLKYLPFFGHDHAVKEIFAVSLEAHALYNATPDDVQGASKKQRILDTLTVLNIVMALFVYPRSSDDCDRESLQNMDARIHPFYASHCAKAEAA